jgi:adenosylhomocysteinase
MRSSVIKDINLHPSGEQKIDWVKRNMPVLSLIEERFIKEQPLKGHKIAVAIHLEAKTAYLAKVLKSGGAEVSISSSNPLSTQDDVAAALVKAGINVYSIHGITEKEYFEHLNMVLDIEPDIIVDDGGDLIQLVHTSRRELLKNIIGGSEETTTGIVRLKSMEREGILEFPMISVNDAYSKYLFDNRYGTGQSVWDGIMRTTNLIVAGKNVVVAGYGWCGRGVALKARGLGANVIITEIDPIKALEAVMDGFRVMQSVEASKIGDYFVTLTGNMKIFTEEHFNNMKDGAILANAGHFDVEIWKPDLEKLSVKQKEMRKNIVGYFMPDGRVINLLAEGRLVNLASGDGHPAEIMDMSFALQALSAEYMAKEGKTLEKKLYNVPTEIDFEVSRIKLREMGFEIDKLSKEQEKYLASWQ